MIELNGVRIWAIAYRDGRASGVRKLACGSIAREPTRGERAQAPSILPGRLELPGEPGTFVGYCGVYRLASGDVAAIYGAVIERLG